MFSCVQYAVLRPPLATENAFCLSWSPVYAECGGLITGSTGGLGLHPGLGSPNSLPCCVLFCWVSLAWTLSSFENHNSSNDTNICHLMSTYYVYLPQFISFDPTALPGSSCYQLHSVGEETEAQAGSVTCPRGTLRSWVQASREPAL